MDDIKLAILIIISFLFIGVVSFAFFDPDFVSILFYAFGGLLVLLGAVMSYGKGLSLVAGFNTMSAKERAEFESKYDMEKVQRGLGVMFLIMGLSWALPLAGINILISSIIIVVVIIASIILINASGRTFEKT